VTPGPCARRPPVRTDVRSALDLVFSLLELGIGDHAAVMQVGELRDLEFGAAAAGAEGGVIPNG